MNIFEILGPVMVGPSSSHTAGAVRIGYISRQLLGEPVKDATLGLYGSFWLTGSGHGTPLALIAGLCGMHPDDARIPRAFAVAKARGMSFRLEQAKLKNAHPNSVQLHLVGESGKVLDLIGQSLGGSHHQYCRNRRAGGQRKRRLPHPDCQQHRCARYGSQDQRLTGTGKGEYCGNAAVPLRTGQAGRLYCRMRPRDTRRHHCRHSRPGGY